MPKISMNMQKVLWTCIETCRVYVWGLAQRHGSYFNLKKSATSVSVLQKVLGQFTFWWLLGVGYEGISSLYHAYEAYSLLATSKFRGRG